MRASWTFASLPTPVVEIPLPFTISLQAAVSLLIIVAVEVQVFEEVALWPYPDSGSRLIVNIGGLARPFQVRPYA